MDKIKEILNKNINDSKKIDELKKLWWKASDWANNNVNNDNEDKLFERLREILRNIRRLENKMEEENESKI